MVLMGLPPTVVIMDEEDAMIPPPEEAMGTTPPPIGGPLFPGPAPPVPTVAPLLELEGSAISNRRSSGRSLFKVLRISTRNNGETEQDIREIKM